MADIIDQISRFERQVESAVDDADRRVDRLYATWTGDAAGQHRLVHEEWMRGVAEMRAGLAAMRRNALTAHGNYTNAVTTNAGMWEQAR